MASTIGKVRAVFTASTSGLTSGVNQASSSFKKLEADVKGLRSGLGTLTAISGAQLFGSIASGASQAIRSLVAMGQAEAEVIDSTNLMAQRLGLTYAELAGLSQAGALVGISVDTIGAALTRADVAFAKAAGGSETATAAFQAIGLSIEQLNGMSASDRFQAIAQAISEIPSEAERSAAAVRLFGKAGATLMPIFNGGRAGIQAATAEAERFGLTLSQAQVDNVDAMGDSFDRASRAISGVIQQVVAYLAPAIESVSSQFSDLIGSYSGATIGQTIGEGILQGARFLAQIGDFLIENLKSVWAYVSQVGSQWGEVFGIGQQVAAFFSGVGDTLQAAFGMLTLAISGPVEALARAAQFIGDKLGIDTSGLDAFIEGAAAFNGTIADGIEENAKSAAANFKTAFFGNESDGKKLGEAIAGPLTTSIDAARARAREAAGQIDVPKKVEVKQSVEIKNSEPLKGVDSRSREGVAEMFRLMRGDTGEDIQQKQLEAQQEIARNTRDAGWEPDVFDLAPAAGA